MKDKRGNRHGMMIQDGVEPEGRSSYLNTQWQQHQANKPAPRLGAS
jgi:hypothetical protein